MLQAGRLADALLLASMGGPDLWNRAQTAFMHRAPRPYMKVLGAVQKADMLGALRALTPQGSAHCRACWLMCRSLMSWVCFDAPQLWHTVRDSTLANKLATAGRALCADTRR